jgi:allantoin racemase
MGRELIGDRTLLVVNPNITPSMTEAIRAIAAASVPPGTNVVAANPDRGPASVQGFVDVAVSAVGVMDVVRSHPEADAVVIACADDTGLDAARCLTSAPVLGVGEAAFHAAAMLSCRFSVITTLRRSVPGIEQNLHRYGLATRCARVRACELPVLALEGRDPRVTAVLAAEVDAALRNDDSEAIVLGCAGMAHLAEDLQARCGVPVVDGVATAAAFAMALVGARLRTSKVGGYAPPLTQGETGDGYGTT